MRCVLSTLSLFLVLVAMTLFAVSPAMAMVWVDTPEIIVNGDFEELDPEGTSFTDWIYILGPSGYNYEVESTCVISGKYSMEVLTGSSQYILDYVSGEYSLDFAAFPISVPNKKAAGFAWGGRTANADKLWAVAIRISVGGELQIYDNVTYNDGYQTIPGLVAATTIDNGNDGKWTNETPVVNHLVLTPHFGEATPNYDVTLNDTTVTGIDRFQWMIPDESLAETFYYLSMWDYQSWLVDNVSVTGSMYVDTKPGDANLDGAVDADDAAILADNWPRDFWSTWDVGDFNHDDKVDDLDATIMATNWTGGAGTSASIPEPAMFVLIAGGLLSLCLWRKRSLE